MRSPIFYLVSNAIAFAALLYGLYLLLKGHTAPGGGFAAGLVMSVALWLRALAHGVAATKKMLSRWLRPVMTVGLALALLSGCIAVFNGDPLFTHYHLRITDSLFLSTTLLFDFGVLLVVIAASATMISGFVEAHP